MSVPWYLMAKGKSGGGYKTASGPIVSVNDALAAPLRSLVANIEPVQSGTGDPSPDNVRPISGWSAVNVCVEPTYDPTANPTATLQLGQTVYGGTLDVTNGVLTVDRAYKQLTKDDAFEIGLSNTFNRVTCLFYPSVGKISGTFVCDSCVTMPNSSGGYGSVVWQIWGSNAASRCWISVPTIISTVEDFKTYLETNPIGIVYELATPITIPLTPTEISTLQGENNVWADSGDVTLEYLASGGANADLMKLAVAFMGRK